MKISVVTVVLDDLEGLKHTSESILCQKDSEFEWIVCDGGSGNDLVEYLRQLSGKALWVSEPDRGIYDAMNKGIGLCNGDYVVFLNAADTFVHDRVLQTVSEKLEESKNAKVDVLYGGANLLFPNDRIIHRRPRTVDRSIWHGLPANHQATYYRLEALINDPYDLKYRICGDYYLAAWFHMKGGRVDYLDEPLANFHVGGTSYKHRKLLFLEPYLIQRDVLKLSVSIRMKSVFKRFISTLGVTVLGQKWMHL